MKSQGICNPYFLVQGHRFVLSLEVHQVGGDISVDRLIARSCSLVPSPRANGRLACGPRGAHLFEVPDAEPPSDSVSSLAALMEHAGRRVRAPSPRAIRSARLRPSWSTPEGESGRRAPERFGQLACGPHGARRKENPVSEPPSNSVGSLAALMEHAGRRVRAPSPRAIRSARLRPSGSTPEGESGRRAPERFGRLACGPHGARRKESPIFECIDHRMIYL